MKTIGSFLARFPQRELDLHRMWRRDESVRSICADHEDATEALHRWRTVGPPGTRQVLHYEALLAELEAEIIARLDTRNDPRRD